MPDRPNIVLCISDQQRADTMPGDRQAAIRTPHLDWLAESSTLFRRAYCTTPMCSPARSSILTGLYPHATGLVANHQERDISRDIGLLPQVPVLADYLKEAGYVCGYTGKWHLGTGGDRRSFTDYCTRAGIHDVDGPMQNDMLQFTQKVGVEIGGKLKGNDLDKSRYDARTDEFLENRIIARYESCCWGLEFHLADRIDDTLIKLLITLKDIGTFGG